MGAMSKVGPNERSRMRWLGGRSALALSLIASLSVLAFALTQYLPATLTSGVADAELASAMTQRKLLSLYAEDIELYEPDPFTLVSGEDWVHPVAGTEELLPTKATRMFQAMRPGHRASECGKGHCGVDLEAPRGSPIVAVRPGVVEKTQRDPEASGGLYVWVRHEDVGLRTEYFHLDRVASGLRAGDQVEAGQWLGSLGKTGIHRSEPHLHFALRDLSRQLRYINPKSFLKKSVIIDVLDLQMPAAEETETALLESSDHKESQQRL